MNERKFDNFNKSLAFVSEWGREKEQQRRQTKSFS